MKFLTYPICLIISFSGLYSLAQNSAVPAAPNCDAQKSIFSPNINKVECVTDSNHGAYGLVLSKPFIGVRIGERPRELTIQVGRVPLRCDLTSEIIRSANSGSKAVTVARGQYYAYKIDVDGQSYSGSPSDKNLKTTSTINSLGLQFRNADSPDQALNLSCSNPETINGNIFSVNDFVIAAQKALQNCSGCGVAKLQFFKSHLRLNATPFDGQAPAAFEGHAGH